LTCHGLCNAFVSDTPKLPPIFART
jgi:hypothetical protein